MKKKTAITNQPGFKTPVSQNSLFFSPNALTMPQPSELLAEMKEKYTWEVLIITETKSLCFFV